MKTCRSGLHQYESAQCIECNRIASRAWKENNPTRYRANWLRHRYWPTLTSKQALDNYYEMMNAQAGQCASCGTHQNDLKMALCVDHDHITNQIRGLLCKPCNLAEGYLKSSKNAEGLVQYMKRLGN